jgi:two-component system cell cycle sensor histidine kinase/response regulator CckA
MKSDEKITSSPREKDMPDYSIMIVEDEELVAADIQMSVEKMGYAVCATASSGLEAIQKAVSTRPDLVLMDIVLKGSMDGIEAATRIKEMTQIPIVYLTAFSDDAVLQRAKVAEPYGYITKPFVDRDLHIAIEISIYRQQAEARIKKMEHWLATVLRSIGDAVIASDQERRITFMNSVAEKLTGWNQEEALGHKLTEVLNIKNQDLADLERNLVDKVIAGKLIINLIEDRLLIGKGGLETPISLSVAPIKGDKGEGREIVLVIRDITDNKALQREVFKARNLESLGSLAGGIAHDFNNLLQGLLGCISAAQRCIPESNQAYQYLEYAKLSYASARMLTSQLVAFSAGCFSQLENLQLSDFIQQAIVSDLSGSSLVAEFDLACDLWLVYADQIQLRQVMKQLTMNAIEAMPTGGSLRVVAVNEVLTSAAAQPGTLAAGRYVKISIQDQGGGISEENLSRIFDPYFSTKERCSQKGMGLGLSLCDTIIRKHGGAITVETKKGTGSTFHIRIPAVIAMNMPSLK